MLVELFECLRAYLHLETVDHVLFALAVAVAARLDGGDPLWGLIIGPPSSGKTEAVRMLDSVADEHPDEVTAPSLLSWPRGTAKDPKPVGILARLPSPGLLTVADFSTVLATSDRGGRDQLFALLRRAFDGAVSRDLGNSPRPLTWRGRLTLLAACTPIIDSYSSHADALGPRWLYCRVDAQDTDTKRATGRKALSAGRLGQRRSRAAHLAAGIVRDALARVPTALDTAMGEQILDAAIVACYGRAAVEREGYGRREISSMAVIEEPPRLTGQLDLLARALLGLGMDADDAVALCRRCALDSIPLARRRAMTVLAQFGEATQSTVANLAGCDRKVAKMALEELAAIGVAIESDDADDSGDGKASFAARPWALDHGAAGVLIRRVVLEHERCSVVGRKVGSTPPSPPSKSMPSYFSSHGEDDADLDPDGDVGDLSLDDLDALLPLPNDPDANGHAVATVP